MECKSISASDLPHTSLLYSTFLNEFSKVSDYYAHPPTVDAVLHAARELSFDKDMRGAVAEILRRQNLLFGGDDATARNIERLNNGALAVVTGQQVGLLGGPAYSVYKALTAIHLANDLTAKGVNAVPVFWLATEDHDLEEVNHVFLAKRGALERFDLASTGAEGRRVGEIPLGSQAREISSRAGEFLEGSGRDQVAQWIAESYRPEETFGSSFAKLMTRIFAGRGLILLDPLSSELHRLSAPVMLAAVNEHKALARQLVAQSAALEKAGYHAQVKVTEESTLAFRIVEGKRISLRPVNGGFAAGNKRESADETLQAIKLHPEEFSPNALLRPVIQDALLPTVAYIGGPAEIAYHAQASVIYKKLLGRTPVILPRAAFTLVPAHVANLLRKYNLDAQDVFAGRQQLRAKMEAEALPSELTARFDEGEKNLQESLGNLRHPLSKLDQTLLGALDTVTEKILYQFNGLRAKAGRAEGFRSGVLNTHESEITNFLLPNNDLQERSLSILTFLASEGPLLLDLLDRQITIGTGAHCVMTLQPTV